MYMMVEEKNIEKRNLVAIPNFIYYPILCIIASFYRGDF